MQSKTKIKLSKLLSYYKPYKWLLFTDMLCSLLAAALALVLPILVRIITSSVAGGAGDIAGEALRIGAIMLAVIAAQTAFSLYYDYKGHDMGAQIERDMRGELFAHYQSLPFRFYDNESTGQLMSRLTTGLLDLVELYHHAPENLVVYGTQFVGSLVILLTFSPRLTLVACALLPVMAVYSFVFYRKLETVYRQNHERMADINAKAEENLTGIRVVKSFAAEELEIDKFRVENTRFYKGRSAIYKHEAFHYTVIEQFLTPLITVAIIVAGSIWIADGTLPPTDLLIFILYAAYLTSPVPKLAFMVQQYQNGMAGYRRFREIMELTPDIRDADDAPELHVSEGCITFENVSFRYGEEQEYVLKDIKVCVRPGETVAIVGPSGIGKTTLCSLIPRFYDVCEGRISIDGIDVRDVTLRSLRQQIGVVRQETFLFAGTVEENIRYGRPGATSDEIREAAQKANAFGFIEELPEGYASDVGQRGAKLSGGQQQRLSIARVFLKNPPIVIFDEATSALDYESEKAVMESLKKLVDGRTAFIIAHRLSTIRNADRILVLSDGRIAEQGTHHELCEAGGMYARIYGQQQKD
ncbi:MAG: ABC transporter ATP-binding protein/permease, partial [Clostridia bacterium]|nr:ABC transporter ATP-binding protein/permease [Clostridia bacterium]